MDIVYSENTIAVFLILVHLKLPFRVNVSVRRCAEIASGPWEDPVSVFLATVRDNSIARATETMNLAKSCNGQVRRLPTILATFMRSLFSRDSGATLLGPAREFGLCCLPRQPAATRRLIRDQLDHI
jgi:hypothetical protein